MGNTIEKQPKNKIGKKVVAQKLENAKKLGVLSLQEHSLKKIPAIVFTISNLRTLDVSKNKLVSLGATGGDDDEDDGTRIKTSSSQSGIGSLMNLKSLNVRQNKLRPVALGDLSKLTKLQIFNAGSNVLGAKLPNTTLTATAAHSDMVTSMPLLPSSLKQLILDDNGFQTVPPSIVDPSLTRLVKLDLSKNSLILLPEEIQNLRSLTEINLDDNAIVAIAENTLGKLVKLKVVSLRNNQLQVLTHTVQKGESGDAGLLLSSQQPVQPNNTLYQQQAIHSTVFTETQLIDLNLAGNPIAKSQLYAMEGFDAFLERRNQIKTKNLYGGAMYDSELCGLDP